MTPFWIPTTGGLLMQGDYLPNCLVPMLPRDFGPKSQATDLAIHTVDLVVITQTCDLANAKAGLAALCPFYPLKAYEANNTAFARKGAWEEVRKGRREGLHLLASPTFPEVGREALVVDFREGFSLPVEYLSQHAAALGPRWRLASPFLEHFSQAYARFYMSVGLPSAVPPIVD